MKEAGKMCQMTAFALCNEARLGWPYLHYTFHYAQKIMDVLPAKGCQQICHGDYRQFCPYLMWFKDRKKVKIPKYKAFGCPFTAKVYWWSTVPNKKIQKSVLDSKNIFKEGMRYFHWFVSYASQLVNLQQSSWLDLHVCWCSIWRVFRLNWFIVQAKYFSEIRSLLRTGAHVYPNLANQFLCWRTHWLDCTLALWERYRIDGNHLVFLLNTILTSIF